VDHRVALRSAENRNDNTSGNAPACQARDEHQQDDHFMPVTLDPSAAAVIAAFRAAGRPPYETMTPVEARAAQALGRPVIQPDPPQVASVEQIVIPSEAAQIPARVYKPLALAQRDGLSAGVIFFHGGGWTIGDLDGYEVVCKSIATEAQMIVISVDYRLAPEHRFPAAVDDALAATKWIAENAVRFGVDPESADRMRRQRRRKPLGRGRDTLARQWRTEDRRTGADLSGDGSRLHASLARGGRHQRAADASAHQVVLRSLHPEQG
jgi:hypothetical protein